MVAPSLEALGIDQLSVEDRLTLVADIWESISAEVAQAPLSDALLAEVERRWAAHLADPDAAIPWEQVKAETLARLRR